MIDLPENSPIFEKIYRGYLAQISGIDLKSVAEKLGIDIRNDEAIIPFFEKPYKISKKGVFDSSGLRPSHSTCVVLFRYLLLCPEEEPCGRERVAEKITAHKLDSIFQICLLNIVATNRSDRGQVKDGSGELRKTAAGFDH